MTPAPVVNAAPLSIATPLTPAGAPAGTGLSFGDVLDAVNPLQHIPIVSSLYRAATGTAISSGSRVAGDTLYGALLPGGAIAGFASSLADEAVKQVTGKNIGQMVVAAVSPPASPPATPLIPSSQSASTTAQQTPIAATPLSSHAAHTPAGQYQRAQILDALNHALVKLKA